MRIIIAWVIMVNNVDNIVPEFMRIGTLLIPCVYNLGRAARRTFRFCSDIIQAIELIAVY